MIKLLISLVVISLVVTCSICSAKVVYSEPTHSDGSSIEWKPATTRPPVKYITVEEYNTIFENYRSGILTKSEASESLRNTKVVYN